MCTIISVCIKLWVSSCFCIRFREAGELYSKAMKFVITGSMWHRDLMEKFENVSRIILLDCACAYAEKGEEAMRNNVFSVARDQFNNALKLHPEVMT